MKYELFEKWGIKINSSAKQIEEALSVGTADAFDSLRITKYNGRSRKDQDYEYADFSNFITQDDKRKILGFRPEEDSISVVRSVLKQVAEDKREDQSKLQSERLAKAAEMNDGTVGGEKKKHVYGKPEQLFRTTTSLKTNSADLDFFANFRYTKDGQLLYKDINGKLYFVFQSIKGLDFKNELGASGEDNLWPMLERDLGVKYDHYCRLANVAWTKADESTNLEEIFTGMTFDGIDETYMIPTFMSNVIAPQPIYRKGADGSMQFDHYRAVSIGPKLLFQDTMDLLSQKWKDWTKGMIKQADGWKNFSNTDEWATNCYHIPKDWDSAEMPDSWRDFFEGNGGKASPRILDRVYFFIGSCLDATNYNQQCLMICDSGGTGKGEMTRLLREIMPDGLAGDITNEALANSRFAVFSHGIYKHHLLFLSEYDGSKANTELFKNLTGGDVISCEVKNGESFNFNAAGMKMILTSNRVCYTKEQSVRRRIIPVVFRRNFAIGQDLSEADKIQLRKDGPDFLKYCYKRYMKSPFRTASGGYVVLNREQADEYIKNGRKFDPSTDYETLLLKAFSADDELCDERTRWFKCGDYSEEGHLNDGYEDIYDALFEFEAGVNLTVRDVKNSIQELCFRSMPELRCELDFDSEGNWQSMKTKKNADFIAFMEKTKGHNWGKVARVCGIVDRIVTNIKYKEKTNEDRIRH